jgi:GT2 family glycosyltransferase/glycosyltransferase involved in cell wall biosynthesis
VKKKSDVQQSRSRRAKSPLISVVIPTFNRAAMLRATLGSFANQTLPAANYEVVVVDDGSEDATPEMCRDFKSRIQLKYLHIENSGISAAKNAGILASRGRILLFADDDDIADRRLLEEQLKAHERHPEENVAVLGYTTWAPTLPVTPLMRYVTEIGRFLFAYGDLQDGQMLDSTYFWGGRSSCKRSLLSKHGMFNRQFRTIIEDMELAYRLSKFGFRVIFHRAAVSFMARPLTFEAVCDRCERQGESLFFFSQLHDDPMVQEYCKLADPFIDNRAVAVDPEARWPEVAAVFREKIEQARRIEQLLSFGFEPEPAVEKSPKAEAYRLQMHDLFSSLQKSLSRTADLERSLSEQEKSHQTELGLRQEHYQAEQRRLTSELEKTREGYESEHQRVMSELERTREGYETELQRLNKELQRLNKEPQRLREGYETELQRLNKGVAQLRDRFLEANDLLQRKSISLAEYEQRTDELTERLRKELRNVRKLSRLLDDADKAAARLRSSRRWKLANPVTAIKAKLSPGNVSAGYGHLEKIVAAYSEWRGSHPEIAKIEDEIKTLQFPSAARSSGADSPEESQKSEAAGPPVPSVPVGSIAFPAHKDVEVSVIIPVFNQFQYTHACLASLQNVKEQTCFEVIVVDDCSTDETADLVPRMEGVIYLRNQTNSGFIASCNRGAETARGEYLFFLNNDTIVKEGWLSALLDTFASDPCAGIVGSKLVYPNGRLQEAGGIVWRDASGWNYGKFDDREKPEYNYLRETDYCSAAALMISRSLFESVGGFDVKYAPAYYEDTDLSFKVRKTGLKVLYQPLSEIIHYEGATGGTDLSAGTKKHQNINRLTFAETWADELIAKPAVGDLTFLRQPPPGRKNILVIDHHLPMPDRDSGSLRMFQILKLLRELGHRVTFIPDNLANIWPYTGELQKRGIEVVYYPYVKKVRDYLISHGSDFDAVVLSRCDFARKHIADVRMLAPQSRIIFDTVDLHFLREESQARLTGDSEVRRKAQERQRLEYELIDQSDETWVVSHLEQDLLQEERPDKPIQVVSNIVEIRGSSTPFALRQGWLFIGSFQHTPNIDAVLFFVQEIYPLVREQLRDAKFYIIGDKAPPEIVALATERIIVVGLQTDVGPFFDSVKLSVAPLRFGAGVKGKVNQSMAFGVPVVATSLAVEGMALQNGEDILVADEPADFARAMVELYESEDLWNRISENGIQKTDALYSTGAARKKLEFLFSHEHLGGVERSAAMAQPDMAIAATS